MPRPKRRKGEKFHERVSRLVRHYIHEGYPQRQAIAIAYSIARRERGIKDKRTKRKTKRRTKR
ncbi:MAG: hypothetical protein QXJ20_02710 [Candidatus Aenigmatarchaeota archaeon]